MDNERKRTSYVTKDPPKSARDQKRNYKRHKRNYNRDVTNAKLELEQNLNKLEMSREVHTNRKTPGQSTQRAKAQSGTDGERTENASYYPPHGQNGQKMHNESHCFITSTIRETCRVSTIEHTTTPKAHRIATSYPFDTQAPSYKAPSS